MSHLLTDKYIQRMLEEVERSPLDLCDRLRMTPDPDQAHLFAACTLRQEHDAVEDQGNTRAAGVLALWRVLRDPNAQVLVLSPTLRTAEPFFDWIGGTLRPLDHILSVVTNIDSRWRLHFGPDRNRCIKRVGPKVAAFEGHHNKPLTGIILDAGNTDGAYPDAVAEFQKMTRTVDPKGHLLLRLW